MDFSNFCTDFEIGLVESVSFVHKQKYNWLIDWNVQTND
jgi:hypothetical protein